MDDGSFFTFTGLVALVVFAVGKIFEVVRDVWVARRARKSFIRSLFAELDYNTADLTKFNSETLDFKDILAAIEAKPDLIPHITDARHTVIYSNNLPRISALHDALIQDVVQFYGDLEKIREIIAGLNKPSFPTISDKGKLKVVMRLYTRTKETEWLGIMIIERFKSEFQSLDLKRKERGKDPRSDEVRLRELSSDLDRIRLRQGLPP